MCGAGGVGKTRLAMRLLAMVADSFPDGVCLVELGDLWEPDLIVSRIASVVGVDGEPGRALLETLAGALESRQLLLMLDNCEHLIDACATLSQRLLASCPGLRVLATSQEPLRIPPESVWQVRRWRCRRHRRRPMPGNWPAMSRSGCSLTGPRRPAPGLP